jgi:hypothetical protein
MEEGQSPVEAADGVDVVGKMWEKRATTYHLIPESEAA